jgi:3-dehydroquinate synthase
MRKKGDRKWGLYPGESMKQIRIDVEPNPYSVYFGRGILKRVSKLTKSEQHIVSGKGFSRKNRGILITNRKVYKHHGKKVLGSLVRGGFQVDLLQIPDGERYKNQKTVTSLYKRLLALKADRRALIFALGGGVIGDLAGFVAATFLRGIPLIHIPTTVIAQVDSSIGGKTGFNVKEGKNLVGSFYNPEAVFVNPDFLVTLSKKEFTNGLAEVVKYGCISSPGLFRFMEENVRNILTRNKDVLDRLIYDSIRIKGKVIFQDPFERNRRRILNFGHTIGHGLENLYGYQGLSHGEAISIGMAWASQIALKLSICSERTCDRITSLLSALGLPTDVRTMRLISGFQKSDITRLWNIMEYDKKVRGGKVHFVLPRRIGQVIITNQVDRKTFIKIISRQR